MKVSLFEGIDSFMGSILIFTLCNSEKTVRVSLLKERNNFNMKVHFIFNLKCQRIMILMIYTIIIPTCPLNGW